MEQNIQTIIDLVNANQQISAEEKETIINKLKETDKKISIAEFKLDRTEKVKRTTAILLEETIEELEQKRKAVEAQNRELEIESSLEKVRTVAMGMRKRDDMLDICRVIAGQLESLGVKEIRNVQTAIFYKDKGTYINYEYYSRHDKAVVTEVDYTKDPLSTVFAEEMIKGGEEIFTRNLTGKQVKDWYDFQKTTNVFIDTYLETSTSLTYYWFSLEPVAIGTSSYVPLGEQELNLFKRFRNVFGLAYQRYIDIEKAEARAQEARIETALERVRAVAMAMKKSEEVINVCEVMYEELFDLGFTNIRNTQIAIDNGEKQAYTGFEYSLYSRMVMKTLPYDDYSMMREVTAEMKQGNSALFQKEISGKDFEEWRGWRNKFVATDDPRVEKASSMCFYLFSIGSGIIGITSFNSISSEQVEILKRFKNVFELSYRRYTDVAKAEAQAREAQVELALERVRARTMAMQKSDELLETSLVLFQQLKELGEPAEQFTIGVIKEEENVVEVSVTLQGNKLLKTFRHDINEPFVMKKMFNAWKANQKTLIIEQQGEELKAYNQIRNKLVQEEMFPVNLKPEDRRFLYVAFYSKGTLALSSNEPRPTETVDLLEKFAKVFDQTYTRFLDLQKAEAQARESQIQLGLERVRARAMAMQNSEELRELIGTVFSELTKLDLALTRCIIWVFEPSTNDARWWMANSEEPSHPMDYYIKYHQHPAYLTFVNEWKKQNLKFTYDLRGPDKIAWDKILFNETELKDLPTVVKNGMKAPARVLLSASFNNFGGLNVASIDPLSEEHFDILLRFAKVFDLTYTRFLDLQKAEAQAREANIEAALERVRSRTMGMQKSDELSETAVLLFQQLNSLGLELRGCGFNIWEKDEKTCTAWMSGPEGTLSLPFNLPLTEDPLFIRYYESRQNGEDFWIYETGKNELTSRYQYLLTLPVLGAMIAKDLKSGTEIELPEFIIDHVVNFSNGNLIFITYKQCREGWDIFKRFGKVFEQTYTRFLDLQKAEAQAREANIEAALERTRTQSMIMQHSKELDDTLRVFHEQVQLLGINSAFSFLWLPDEEKEKHIFWAIWEENKNGSTAFKNKAINYPLDKNEPATAQCLADWNSDEPVHSYPVPPSDVENYFAAWAELFGGAEKLKPEHFPAGLYYIEAFMRYGCFGVMLEKDLNTDEKKILGRFSIEFERTYTRFLDLQKAEAQAREATIEAALEKVRGKAMAMHNSSDVSVTASLVFTELRKLGINPIRCGVGLLNKESRNAQLYSATSSADGDSLSLVGWVELSGHPVLESIYGTWLQNKDYYPELQGEQLKSYYELLLAGLSVNVPDWQDGQKQFGHFLPFSVGCLYAWSDVRYDETGIQILKRFASIIDLTFRRYLELQTSEANAREAIKQAALDRIRADIASMRTVTDLERITPLIWNELTILGIPFIRCGVFIMDDSQQLIHTFLSTPDGKAIAAFHLPYNTPGNIGEVLNHWRNKRNYIDRWDEEEFTRFAEILVKQGALVSAKNYLKTIPHGGFYLHFLPFLQGMLYVGNTIQLREEEIRLIQSIADAFSTAYARYEDFTKLEAAKQQVDKTLVDLKQAQTQLVQSEKMASLGELTAGIAHEIQNPLNFVNNFSDVSSELLNEMKEELEKGNYKDALAIANDVKHNLEKINHHGRRADGIVKGMLQHSRSSSGQKEPTNINVLADEYVRLCYHGLRAKDKSFNATIKTDFDNSIGIVDVIPQDLGRVILNLLTNAFYVVDEKKKSAIKNYEPVVSISTKKTSNKVEIIVNDNGNGIPQKVLDKIFQPFFTTKPTGQGTGLGLSLSYDIITKGHGGELKVETKEGEGTTFIVQLPANSS